MEFIKRKGVNEMKRFCFKCKKEIKEYEQWYIVKNRVYCKECALKLIRKGGQ